MKRRHRMAVFAMCPALWIARPARAADDISSTGSILLSGSSLILQNPAGTLNVGSIELGGIGSAEITQSAGTLSITGTLKLAATLAGKATYNLDGGMLLADRTFVGAAGQASFNQSGGRHRATFVYLGSLGGGSGVYRMAGDSDLFVTTSEAVGLFGTGVFAQSGGIHFGGLEMYVGANSGASGIYDLSGSAILFNGSQFIGNYGTGSFIQRENSHNEASSDLSIGSYSSGIGSYSLSDNSDLIVYQSEYVGRGGRGTFTQDGGMHTVGNGLYVGRNLSGSGTYALTGAASLMVGGAGEFIGYGGRGTFTQVGGGHAIASNLFIAYNSASAGTYSMSGGSLNVGSSLYVGGDNIFDGGNASFIVGGGAVNVAGSTRVWKHGQINYNAGYLAAGAVTLSGGGKILVAQGHDKVLQMNGLTIDSSSKLDLADNSAIISHTAGDSTVASTSSLLRAGYNLGNWLGKGITSSSASADLTKSLGYAEVSPTNLLIQYAWAGDANLDGQVDDTDLLTVSQHLNTPSIYWSDGDFNYDGTVDTTDLNILQSNWQAGVGSPLLAPIVTNLGLPKTDVPECFSTILVTPLFVAGLLRRRRSHAC